MISAATECLSALLTIVLLTGFLYLCLAPRVRPNPASGRLLCSLKYPRWRQWLQVIGAVIHLAVAIGIAVAVTLGWPAAVEFPFLTRPDRHTGLWGAAKFLFSLTPFWLFLLVIATIVLNAAACLVAAVRGVDLREKGLVLDHGRMFIPWAKVRYCWWKSANRRLVIRFKREFLRLARLAVRVDVASDQFDRVERILLRHVEVRDPDGRPIPPPADPGEPPTPIEEPPALRNRLQFDLKTVLLLFLTVASACGWLTIRWQRERPREDALMRLASLQATVNGFGGHPWLVDLSKCPCPPSDEDLAGLATLSSLNTLLLAGSPITDAGLAHLRGLTRLEWLDLSGTQVTDAGLAQLRDLTRLLWLDLSGTRTTGSGIKELSGCTGLEILNLKNSDVTDDGLAGVAGLRGLTTLSLGGTRVTDAGLVRLAGLRSLEAIELSGTGVTDGGIEHLQKLHSLRDVSLPGTKVTESGRKRLKAALPNVTIR